MTSQHDRSRRTARRVVAMALLRAAAAATLVVVAYYLAPLDKPLQLGTWIGFVLGLLFWAGLIGWQIRAVVAAEYPRLRAIEAAATGLPLFIVLFAAIYTVMQQSRPGSFSEVLTRTDALYFTVTVFSTVGFGDIVPVSEAARIVTMLQMLGGLVIVGLVAKLLLGAAQTGLRRREQERTDAARSPDRPD